MGRRLRPPQIVVADVVVVVVVDNCPIPEGGEDEEEEEESEEEERDRRSRVEELTILDAEIPNAREDDSNERKNKSGQIEFWQHDIFVENRRRALTTVSIPCSIPGEDAVDDSVVDDSVVGEASVVGE